MDSDKDAKHKAFSLTIACLLMSGHGQSHESVC